MAIRETAEKTGIIEVYGLKWSLKIYRRGKAEWLAFFIFIMTFLLGFFIELLRLPRALRYSLDLAWLMLLVSLFAGRAKGLYNERVIPLGKWILIFFAYTLIAYLFNYQSLLYYLWGVRNNFRMYAFFLACCAYIEFRNVSVYLKWIDILFYINAAAAFLQFFALGYNGDCLGGIFGVSTGCNGYLNLFLAIAVSKSIVFYLGKKEKAANCAIKCLLALVIAAFAELKFFYAEFIIVLVMAVLLTKSSRRKAGITVLALAGVFIGIHLLGKLFPGSKAMLSFAGLFETAASDMGYTSSGDMNRLTVFAVSDRLFLQAPVKKIFGLGLGNCDAADAFAVLTSPFYRANGHLHYYWLSTAMVYLETGFAGLAFFFGFFIMAFLGMRKIAKANPERRDVCVFAQIVAVVCCAVAVYNSSLRTEAGYMAYFVLALPFCGLKPKQKRRSAGIRIDR